MNGKDEIMEMPAEVDFSDSVPNPYIGKVRRRVTMNIDDENIDYFKAESARTVVPYQVIISMYLAECRGRRKRLTFAKCSGEHSRLGRKRKRGWQGHSPLLS